MSPSYNYTVLVSDLFSVVILYNESNSMSNNLLFLDYMNTLRSGTQQLSFRVEHCKF